jgi:hypothetical protein
MASIKDFPAHKSSPFEKKGMVKKKFTPPPVTYTSVEDAMQGIKNAVHLVGKTVEKDADTFTYIKVFKEGLQTIGLLNSRAQRILWHILQEIKPGQEEIRLGYRMMSEKYKELGNNNYYYGIVNLLEYGVLARGYGEYFYINVNMFYNGDRKKRYKGNDMHLNQDNETKTEE